MFFTQRGQYGHIIDFDIRSKSNTAITLFHTDLAFILLNLSLIEGISVYVIVYRYKIYAITAMFR